MLVVCEVLKGRSAHCQNKQQVCMQFVIHISRLVLDPMMRSIAFLCSELIVNMSITVSELLRQPTLRSMLRVPNYDKVDVDATSEE